MQIAIQAAIALSVIGALIVGILLYYHKQTLTVWITFTTIVLIALTFCLYWQDSIWNNLNSQSSKSPDNSIPKKDNTKTLHELYLNDFNVSKMMSKMDIKLNNKDTYVVEYTIWFDLHSKSQFFSVYLPASSDTFNIIKLLIRQYRQIIDSNNKTLIHIVSSRPGEKDESLANLLFAGRVYIYHETHLLQERVDSLTQEYKQANLFPQFRSHDYLIMKHSPLYK